MFTDRLILELLTAAHAKIVFSDLQDLAIYEWISLVPPQNISLLERAFKKRESRQSPDKNEIWLNWVIREKANGPYVGTLDVTLDLEGTATNIGYVFFSKHWGKGYATEAVQAVTSHLQGRGISKIIATVTKGNVASERVLQKCGFVQTRILRDNDTIRGLKFDDIEYVLK